VGIDWRKGGESWDQRIERIKTGKPCNHLQNSIHCLGGRNMAEKIVRLAVIVALVLSIGVVFAGCAKQQVSAEPTILQQAEDVLEKATAQADRAEAAAVRAEGAASRAEAAAARSANAADRAEAMAKKCERVFEQKMKK
jgi:hypothetical protein